MENGRIHLEVQDQGMGIPEESLPHRESSTW